MFVCSYLTVVRDELPPWSLGQATLEQAHTEKLQQLQKQQQDLVDKMQQSTANPRDPHHIGTSEGWGRSV